DQRALFYTAQRDTVRGLAAVDGPGEPDGVLVHVQDALVRLGAVGRVAAPELVLAGQVDVGVLGQPHAQRGRVGQRLVHDLRWGRNDRAQAQVRLRHWDLPSDIRRPPSR